MFYDREKKGTDMDKSRTKTLDKKNDELQMQISRHEVGLRMTRTAGRMADAIMEEAMIHALEDAERKRVINTGGKV